MAAALLRLSTPLRSSLNCGTQCYRMTAGTLCESSSPSGLSASQERRESRTRPCRKLRIAAYKGQIDADLGGEVIKQRIARRGQGRSSGYRTIILFRRGTKAFFVYGFPKSQRANIDADERKQFREAAKHVLALAERQLAELLKRGDFIEVKEDGQEIPK